jgi:septal ring factor EnvC (AmiA/AmiB activator)
LQLIEAQRFALAHGETDTSALVRRIRALEAENSRLRAQLEAGPDTLRRVNDERQASAERLREGIAQALGRETDRGTLTAKQVLRTLEREGFEPLPSERTVLRHLTDLRGHGHTPRGDQGD